MAKRIEFQKPDELAIPEGISKSGEFEALATLKLKEDGKTLCLVAIDGNRMKGYREEDDNEPEADDGKGYAEAASEGMEGMM